ncbi:28S ribosomal protein S30, mitochondrial [Araneus ventricosus]|uniref:28S ribosomal protein S30, mitochondrial n=1 Tax=Araneus ventricosus TaxID=182803 RepID=A0A4Y2BDL8_ARAVE|nr:28S ribosomal protein S30, mitochondrial [Araneus ventricosus]
MVSQCIFRNSSRVTIFCKRLKFSINCLSIRLQHKLAEVTNQTCEYPPIVDMSKEGQRRHQRQMWYDSIKAMPTVEEKLYELAVQQRLHLKKYFLTCVPPSYTGIFFNQFITRTHLMEGLPDKINNINVEDELSDIKDTFNEVLLNYYHNPWQSKTSKQLSDYLSEKGAGSRLLNQLITQCYKRLASKNEHILESTIQHKPRINSFWWHNGFESKDDEIYEKNLAFRYEEFPAFVIRMKKPLSPIVDMNDPLCATAEVLKYHYHPEIFEFPCNESDWLSSVPGFWPGDQNEFPLLQVFTSDKLQNLLMKIENYDLKKIENSLGLMGSFGYLNTIANYQGFTPFHDITYPFVGQTILTNGQDFTFFVYQLNTIAFHEDVDNKDRRNLCWTSGKLRLFETIEDGQLKGVNEDVYRLLLKFLLNTPEVKEGQVLKPYLGVDTRTEEEIKNMRFFLRRMYSQKRAHNAHKDEVPMWVKIYKNHPDAPPSPYVKLE